MTTIWSSVIKRVIPSPSRALNLLGDCCLEIFLQEATVWSICGLSQVLSLSREELLKSHFSFHWGHQTHFLWSHLQFTVSFSEVPYFWEIQKGPSLQWGFESSKIAKMGRCNNHPSNPSGFQVSLEASLETKLQLKTPLNPLQSRSCCINPTKWILLGRRQLRSWRQEGVLCLMLLNKFMPWQMPNFQIYLFFYLFLYFHLFFFL